MEIENLLVFEYLFGGSRQASSFLSESNFEVAASCIFKWEIPTRLPVFNYCILYFDL